MDHTEFKATLCKRRKFTRIKEDSDEFFYRTMALCLFKSFLGYASDTQLFSE